MTYEEVRSSPVCKRSDIQVSRIPGPEALDLGWSCHGCGEGTEPGDFLFDYGNMLTLANGKFETGISLMLCFDCRQELVEKLFREQVNMLKGKKLRTTKDLPSDETQEIIIPPNAARIKREEVA